MNQQRKIKRALISVYDKTGLVEFAHALLNEFGIEIISTGGTAKHLKEGGIPVTLVEDITGFPEMLDGRVKTLHPKIHAAILADRDNPDHMRQLKEQGIEPIDMVVVNLYPFEKTVSDPNCTFEQAIEMIDIGGPTMLRAAAKNHRHVIVVTPMGTGSEFDEILTLLRSSTGVLNSDRVALARQVFGITTEYDEEVWTYLSETIFPDERNESIREAWREPDDPAVFPQVADWDGYKTGNLRYGENPHQQGALYEHMCDEWDGGTNTAGLVKGTDVIQGEMSFNNYVDANAALELCREISVWQLPRPVSVFIKHTNACGVGTGQSGLKAYEKAYLGDTSAAYGGILAQNEKVTAEMARHVINSVALFGKHVGAQSFFLEVWIAPSFDGDAIAVLREKNWGTKCRLLAVTDMTRPALFGEWDFKKITGGMLVQERDVLGLNEDQWKVVTKRKPSESEISDLRLAWLIAKHTKSNAISICKDGMLIGNGAGQMSRVMSCRIATWLAKENRHEDKLKGSVAASDAFFPFPDGPNILMDAGVSAIIQPGGSKNDDKTIAACDERNVAMIFTGTRHFKH